MAISKDWYNTEFEENETESKHRPPSVEYSFYTAVKTGDMETVIQNCNADSFTNLEGTGVLALPMGLQEPEMVVLHLVPEALTAVTIPKPAIHQVWHLMEL